MKLKYLLIITLGVVFFTGCKKWLDVRPKTEIESTVAFADEQGFKDALTGIYVKLTGTALYGRELTYGTLDVLAKQYTTMTSGNPFYQLSLYNYLDTASRSKLDGIWNSGYNVIANDNNLIANLNSVELNKFSGHNYEIIKGEAYALRAFMHFDLLRLYSRSPTSAGSTAVSGIPYSETLSKQVSSTLSIAEVINKIQADLQVAATLLKVHDPIVSASGVPATGYLRDRRYKFNYYAVKALQARVYLYNNDKVNALACAREVISSGAFTFTASSQIAVASEESRNKVFTSELIFSLNIPTLQTAADSYFLSNTGIFSAQTSQYLTVYENNQTDYRYVYLTKPNDNNTLRYSNKIVAPTASAAMMPLIRWSEMYYIAAECLQDTDPSGAVNYLNLVRRQRNLLNDLSSSLTPLQIQNEIFKEYRKEFLVEGQLFYYYKRLNKSTIEFSTVTANDNIYVLPKPDNQTEYGN